MRVMLFDWTAGGHHALYLDRFAGSLRASAEVVVAAPAAIAPRPALDLDRPLPPQHRELAERELDLLQEAGSAVRPDRIVHMYADPVIRRLIGRPPLPAPTLLCVFFPRAHYRSAFGARLGAREHARASGGRAARGTGRGRPDSAGVMTLDEFAAERWARRSGSPAHWLPEPPVGELPAGADDAARSGAVLFGSLAPRKGVGLLAAAVSQGGAGLKVTLAGGVEEGYADTLQAEAERMRAAGAEVDLRARPMPSDEGIELIARARCAVLPYPRHYGMSRVLLEAAAVGTPVIVPRDGLLGELVRRHDLGLAVACADPSELAAALHELAGDPHGPSRYRDALATFAARYGRATFDAQLAAALGTNVSTRVKEAV